MEGKGIWRVTETNTTTTDAAIEELEQLIEIEEAGYALVMTRHRQTYIGFIEPGPCNEERWHVRKAERRASGRDKLAETFDSKAAALAACRLQGDNSTQVFSVFTNPGTGPAVAWASSILVAGNRPGRLPLITPEMKPGDFGEASAV